jgi:hypothetical protein
MDNQHRKIKGYRELAAEDIALMNEIKEEGARLEALVNKVRNRVSLQRLDQPAIDGEKGRLDAAEPERWAAMGRTDLQTGLMKLVRAVAQPGSF